MLAADVVRLEASFAVRVDDVSSTITYVGEAPIRSPNTAPVWRIKKLETLGSVFSITWADGNMSFDNVWNDRASLSYL